MTISQTPYTSPAFLAASFAYDQAARPLMPLHIIGRRYAGDPAGMDAALVRRANTLTSLADLRAAINLATGLAVADLDSLGYQR